jgi:hypothetical protein
MVRQLSSELNGNELRTTEQRVAWILEHVPATRNNYVLLILTYWSVFDRIDIPSAVVEQILARGTEPETINRSRRKINELRRQMSTLREEIEQLWQEEKPLE